MEAPESSAHAEVGAGSSRLELAIVPAQAEPGPAQQGNPPVANCTCSQVAAAWQLHFRYVRSFGLYSTERMFNVKNKPRIWPCLLGGLHYG